MEALLEMLDMFKLDEVFLRQSLKAVISLCGQDGKFQRRVSLARSRAQQDRTFEKLKQSLFDFAIPICESHEVHTGDFLWHKS